MGNPSRPDDPRSRWRVIVLLLVLLVVLALIWRGEDVLGAVGAAFFIFLLAAHVIRWVLDDRDLPSLGTIFTRATQSAASPTAPEPSQPAAPPAKADTNTGQPGVVTTPADPTSAQESVELT
jgi:hypothetical protein